jgi:multiple sugar transport system substrate-binding protein
MRGRAVVLAAAIVMAPLGARSADLVVWWEKGFYPQEDEAVREIVAVFEQDTGKQVELVFHSHDDLPTKVLVV